MAGAVIFVRSIMRAVAEHYGVPEASMREPFPEGKCGINPCSVSHTRQVAMLLATRLTEQSLVSIGQRFGGRDHSTVIHACREVEKRSRTDPQLRNAMRRLTLELARR